MGFRKVLMAGCAATAGLMLAASAAWACVAASGPYLTDVTPSNVPVLTAAHLSGANWQAGQVNLGMASTPSSPVQSLGTATVDSAGSFSATVTVPQVASGFYYMVATQGSTTKAMPIEVSAPASAVSSTHAAATPVVAPNVAALPNQPLAVSQQWLGLRASSTQLPGLGHLAPVSHHSSVVPELVLTFGAVFAMSGLLLAEVLRRHAEAHAEARHEARG